MSLADFWKQLEDRARPDVEKRLAEMGFELVGQWAALHRGECDYRHGRVTAPTAGTLLDACERHLEGERASLDAGDVGEDIT